MRILCQSTAECVITCTVMCRMNSIGFQIFGAGVYWDNKPVLFHWFKRFYYKISNGPCLYLKSVFIFTPVVFLRKTIMILLLKTTTQGYENQVQFINTYIYKYTVLEAYTDCTNSPSPVESICELFNHCIIVSLCTTTLFWPS